MNITLYLDMTKMPMNFYQTFENIKEEKRERVCLIS